MLEMVQFYSYALTFLGSQLPERLSSENQRITRVDEDVEQREPSCAAVGNAH